MNQGHKTDGVDNLAEAQINLFVFGRYHKHVVSPREWHMNQGGPMAQEAEEQEDQGVYLDIFLVADIDVLDGQLK